MTYHVACNVDDKFIQHCMTMLCSLFDNNRELSLFVHVLCSNELSSPSRLELVRLAEQFSQKIEFSEVDEGKLESSEWRMLGIRL